MSHEPDLNRLAALVDGRLSADERERVLSHVADCRECRDLLSLLAQPAALAPAAWWLRPAAWLPVAASLAVASLGVLLVTAPGRAPIGPAMPPSIGADRNLPPTGPGTGSASPSSRIPPPTPAPSPADAGDLSRRRSGARQIGAKTFQNVAGEWIDSSYDPAALLPVVEVTTDSVRRELLARLPALEPYAGLGNRVTVVHEGTVYRFVPTP